MPAPGFADLVQSLLADWRGGGVAVNAFPHESGVMVVADGHYVAITPLGVRVFCLSAPGDVARVRRVAA